MWITMNKCVMFDLLQLIHNGGTSRIIHISGVALYVNVKRSNKISSRVHLNMSLSVDDRLK